MRQHDGTPAAADELLASAAAGVQHMLQLLQDRVQLVTLRHSHETPQRKQKAAAAEVAGTSGAHSPAAEMGTAAKCTCSDLNDDA